MFIGLTIAGMSGSEYSGVNTPTTATKLEIYQQGIDELYATRNVQPDFNWIFPTEWDYHIILKTSFINGDTEAGNVMYKEATVVKLKKRLKGEFDWKTIYEQDVKSADNLLDGLNINYDDYLEPNKAEVEYAYVAVINNRESEPMTTEITSQFYNYWLVGQYNDGVQTVFPGMFNVDHNVTLNRPAAVIPVPGMKYPYVVSNGVSRYYTGSFTASFMPHDSRYEPEPKYANSYRNSLDDFLADGLPKVFKTLDGDIYMILVSGNISRTNHTHYQNVSQTFEWTEIGNPLDVGDLYDNGFINTDTDRSS